MSTITIKEISKAFGNVEVLKPFTETFEDGEFITLLGPSGCGKTTMLRLIAGFEKPTSGEILIGDNVVSGGKTFVPPEKRDIGMVFQSYAVWPHMNVFDNVAYPLKISGVKKQEIKERVEKVLEIVHLSQYKDRIPSELSGGQQQRVALGRALIGKPKLLLLDEPLSNLDAKLRVEMREEIVNLKNKLGSTVIYVTHDQTEAMTLGTRIVVMKDGVIQQIDTPKNLHENPVNIFVAGFIGSPQKNFIELDVVEENGEIFLRKGTLNIKIPLPKSTLLKERGYVGKSIIFGIRPEDIHDDLAFLSMNEETAKFKSEIKVYEMMGAEVFLYFDVEGNEFIARVNPRTNATVGAVSEFSLDLNHIHLFDKETTQAIR